MCGHWPLLFHFTMKDTQGDGFLVDLHPEGSCSGRRYEVYKRIIVRPMIRYDRAVVFLVGHFALGFLIAFLIGLWVAGPATDAVAFALRRFWLFALGLLLLTSRFSLIFFVLLYQRYAKEDVRLRCYMTPSCSEYAIIALKKYGAVIGVVKTIGRLKRCKTPGFVDYPRLLNKRS